VSAGHGRSFEHTGIGSPGRDSGVSPEPVLVMPARGRATASLIFFHGLGADAHDFEPLADALDLPGCRYLFPNAPIRPVTLNGGYPMRAWFDIKAISRSMSAEPEGLRESLETVGLLFQRELREGIAGNRILIGGFSQGGAVALAWANQCRDPLLGIVGLSTFLPIGLEKPAGLRALAYPIFLAHGRDDPIVPLALAEETREYLAHAGHAVTWCTYPMRHEVSAAETQALRAWLSDRLGV